MKKYALILGFAALTACSHSKGGADSRKVSNIEDTAFLAPDGTETLFNCYDEDNRFFARIVVNKSIKDAENVDIDSGTSKVVAVLRKMGSSGVELEVIDSSGRNKIYYNAPIQEDLHKGSNKIFPEDIAWPRGLWESKQFEFQFHPDWKKGENVEIYQKHYGATLRCRLPSNLRRTCC